jgi:regulator of sigma E protease
MTIEPKVAAVAEGSPAARAGIAPGAVLTGMTIPPLKEKEKEKEKEGDDAGPEKAKAKARSKSGAREVEEPRKYAFGPAPEGGKARPKDVVEAGWPFVSALLQEIPRREVTLTVAGSSQPIALTPARDPSWSYPQRGLNFLTDIRDLPPQPFPAAIRRATEETYDNVVGIYAMIRSLFQGRVSTKNLAGLPRIAEISYHTASLGLIPLIQFLGMLSINLAVLNFLPIPPLDGGQIAFLVAEKVRGKPLPDSALTVFMIAGLALVACLMLFTILQDFYLMIFG